MKRQARPITMRQLAILAALDREPTTYGQLAEWLKCNRVTALQALQRLEAAGLCDTGTKRLTTKGRTALRNAHATLAAVLGAVHQ